MDLEAEREAAAARRREQKLEARALRVLRNPGRDRRGRDLPSRWGASREELEEAIEGQWPGEHRAEVREEILEACLELQEEHREDVEHVPVEDWEVEMASEVREHVRKELERDPTLSNGELHTRYHGTAARGTVGTYAAEVRKELGIDGAEMAKRRRIEASERRIQKATLRPKVRRALDEVLEAESRSEFAVAATRIRDLKLTKDEEGVVGPQVQEAAERWNGADAEPEEGRGAQQDPSQRGEGAVEPPEPAPPPSAPEVCEDPDQESTHLPLTPTLNGANGRISITRGGRGIVAEKGEDGMWHITVTTEDGELVDRIAGACYEELFRVEAAG